MASIRTGIELNDNFSSVLYGIINSVNLAVSAMHDMSQTMNAGIDTSSLEGAREQLNQATIAADELNQALHDIGTPVNSPLQRAPVQQEPVQVPIQWQSDNLNVFNGTGVERFEQEIQSANNMLNTLNETQRRIGETALNLDIFPSDATQDIMQIGTRIRGIQAQIQRMEENPLDMNTGAANADLEHLRAQLNSAIQEQNNLNQAVQDMDVGAANNAYLRLSQTISSTERYIRDNIAGQEQFNDVITEGSTRVNSLVDMIKRAAGAYLTLQSVKGAVNASDELAQTTARLELMNDGLQSTQDLINMTYIAAQDARGAFNDMASVVARFGNNAKDAFSSSAEVIQFANLIQKSMTIAGASTSEASNAMLQLSQALGSGVLRGDELNSIFENAPNLIRNIADYLDKPIGAIRDMAKEGELTADVVKAAIFAASDDINAKFEEMPMTWGQACQSMKNTAIMAFQPVLQRINKMVNSEGFQVFANNVINAMAMIASVVLNIFDLVGSVGTFIADNWSIIEPIVYAVVFAMGLYTAALAANAIAHGISSGATAISTFATKVHTAALARQRGATFKATVEQYGFNTALLACPITWIVLAIIEFIAIVYALTAAINQLTGETNSATGIICGTIAMAAAAIWNVILGVVNAFIGIGVELYNLIATFANFFANVFNDPVGAIINLFSGMFDFILGIVQSAASLIDTVLGSDISGAVEGFRNDFSNAVADIVGDQTVVMEKLSASDYQFNGVDYIDAFGAGYDFGEKVDEKIQKLDLSKLTGKTHMPDKEDYVSQLANNGANITKNTGDTKKNTDKIAKQLDITSEDLKYLRDIAERDIVNRFTTAQIKVDMTNHNTINNDMDLDGVTEHLRTTIEEQMYAAAEGVH